ncbi:hypothetical protein ACWEPM_20410 [Streptomyces sp. NPDC004244]
MQGAVGGLAHGHEGGGGLEGDLLRLGDGLLQQCVLAVVAEGGDTEDLDTDHGVDALARLVDDAGHGRREHVRAALAGMPPKPPAHLRQPNPCNPHVQRDEFIDTTITQWLTTIDRASNAGRC